MDVFYSYNRDSLSMRENLHPHDLTVEEAIRDAGLTVDRDTRGVAGTPPNVACRQLPTYCRHSGRVIIVPTSI
jgi:hypothetical protein